MSVTSITSSPVAQPVQEPKDPAALSRTVVIWIYVSLGASVLSFAAAAFKLSANFQFPGAPSQGIVDVETVLNGLSALATLATFLVTGFLTLKWIYRVNLNAKILAPDKTITPGWAVGWYFVPFAALWKPYQAIRETWQICVAPKAWQTATYPILLRQWWTLWIIGNILQNVSFRLSMESDLPGSAMISDVCGLIGDLVDLPLDLVFIMLVRHLTTLQVSALSGRSFD
jgi:hypothetical protein